MTKAINVVPLPKKLDSCEDVLIFCNDRVPIASFI